MSLLGRDDTLVKDVWSALETSVGCLELVQADRKPIDLDECLEQVKAAFDDLTEWMDSDD